MSGIFRPLTFILIQRTGVINHNKTAGHANVPAHITKENTRIEGVMVDGKFVPQAHAADTAASHSSIAQSLEEVRS